MKAAFNSFTGIAAGLSLLAAFAVSAQELPGNGSLAGKDVRTIRAAACSKDRQPVEGFFHINVAPLGQQQWLTPEQVFPAVARTWNDIAAALTADELVLEEYAEQSGAVFDRHVGRLEKSWGWNGADELRRVQDIEGVNLMNPSAEDAPNCGRPDTPPAPPPGGEKRYSL